MPYFSQSDRTAISSWFRFQATAEDRAAIQKEFGFADRTIKQYLRTGKSGREILPARLVGRDSELFTDKDKRLAQTLRSLVGDGLRVSSGSEDTKELFYRNFKSLDSAANEVQRVLDRAKADQNGDRYILINKEKVYIQSVKLRLDGRGGYDVIILKPRPKEAESAGSGKEYQGRGADQGKKNIVYKNTRTQKEANKIRAEINRTKDKTEGFKPIEFEGESYKFSGVSIESNPTGGYDVILTDAYSVGDSEREFAPGTDF